MLLPKGLVKDHAHILIVDDQEANRLIVRHTLEKDGFQNIAEAENGKHALRILDDFPADIILLDIMMPEMDGFEMCKSLKQNAKTADIPILFLTGLDDNENRTIGYRLGAVDYVNKPVESKELLARTAVHIHNGMLRHRLQDYYTRVSADLEKARRFQTNLLPGGNALARLCADYPVSISAHFQASEELAGDYWQIFPVDESHFAITLVDFTGHGVAAALNTATINGLFQELDVDLSDPIAVTTALNKRLRKILSIDSFATCFYGVYACETYTMTYVSCGAVPPAVVPKSSKSKVKILDNSGYPLGIVDQTNFEPELRTIKLAKDDTLLLYSDALPEALHAGGKRWLDDGTLKAIESAQKTNNILEALIEDFNRTADTPLKDDLTLIALSRA